MKNHSSSPKGQRGSVSTWVFAGFALVALFFLLAEHRAHLYGWLPYILLAACPLMHLFHGHGRHGNHSASDEPRRRDDLPPNSNTTKPGAAVPPAVHQHH